MTDIKKRLEYWSECTIVAMNYSEEDDGTSFVPGHVSLFFDYEPGPGKVYDLHDEEITCAYLTKDEVKALITILQEFVDA